MDNEIGAAGIACSKILLTAGVKKLIAVDREGAIVKQVHYANPMWNWNAQQTNPNRVIGTLAEVLAGADVFIGLSAGRILTHQDVMTMAPQPIVFTMANPVPVIAPEEFEDIAAVIAAGRSYYPNQINNVLFFPGIFRGALDYRTINEEMKVAAAEAIALVLSDEERNEAVCHPKCF